MPFVIKLGWISNTSKANQTKSWKQGFWTVSNHSSCWEASVQAKVS